MINCIVKLHLVKYGEKGLVVKTNPENCHRIQLCGTFCVSQLIVLVFWPTAVSLLSSTVFSEFYSISTELGPLRKYIAISSRCVVMCAVDYIFNPQRVPEGRSSDPTLDLH